MNRLHLLLVLCGAFCGWHQDSESKRPCNTYLGKPVPALSGGKNDWLNVGEAPRVDGARGRAILVAFTSLF